jgi:glycerol-3-phosphate cytidylyltransferase-like family protein
MALVHEETKHEYLGAQIMVSQRERREVIEDWAICHLEVESMDRRTPDELVELGEWLIAQGKRIKGAYRKNGARRNSALSADQQEQSRGGEG